MKSFTKLTSICLLFGLLISLTSIGLVQAQGVTIRYANWNVGTEEENNLQRQLVAAYVAANPEVTVEFVDMSGDGRWDEKLTNLAARGELPDVWMADVTPYYIQNGWAADLSELVAADPDWANVPATLQNAATYNGSVLALPAAQFVMGYWVNTDLFEAANLDAPTYGVTLDDFLAGVSAVNNVEQGVLGLNEMEPILGWYASTQDSALGWFSYDGTHMNYNADAFRAAVDASIELMPLTWQGLSEEQRTAFAAQGPWELFLNQEVGAQWDGGWVVPGYAQNATFNWDFVGIPGGNQAMVTDLLVVSAETANLEAAYDFAKWMSFSSEGYALEAELAAAANAVPNRMPVSVTPESIDLYMSFVGDRPGLRMALENLDNSLLESLAKVVPGYVNARWEGKPGIDIGENLDVNMWFMFANVATGQYEYANYAPQLEEFANGLIDAARAELS